MSDAPEAASRPHDHLRDRLQASFGTAYTIERELGGGGMSRVFMAREEALQRDVVVKVLTPELAAGLSAERFAREIRLAARLQDAHIVPVLVAGVTLDGLPYYTMPFVRGESLRRRMEAGALPLVQRIGILRNVAQALAAAHAHGVVHRDIKPENVLLSGDTALVTDFGIARALGEAVARPPGESADARGTLTVAGTSLGTPAYMSPEQAVGDAVDHRADLYAWGVVAYELLAGRHPFAGRTSAQQLVAAHIAETPPALGPHVPDAALAALVMRCLEKDPARRPPRAVDVLAALDAAGARTSVSPSSGIARRRALVGLAAVVASVAVIMVLRLVGGGSAGSRLAEGTVTQREPLILTDFTVANADTTLGPVVSDAVRAALQQSAAISLVPAARVAAAIRRMERSPGAPLDLALAREVSQREGVKAVIDGSVTGVAGGYVLTLRLVSSDSAAELATFQETGEGPRGLIDAADRLARRLRAAAGESLSGIESTPPLASVTTASLAALRKYSEASRAAYLDGDFFKAVRLAREAVAIDTGFAMGWRMVASQMRNASMPRAGIDSALERAYRLRERLPERERALATLGYLDGPGRDRARALSARAAMLEQGDSTVLVELAVRHLDRRDFARAEALTRAALGRDSTRPIPYMNLARILVNRGRASEAVAVAREGRRRAPDNTTMASQEVQARYHAGDHDAFERAVDSIRTSGDDRIVDWGQLYAAFVALSHGRRAVWRQRLSEFHRQLAAQGSVRPALVDSLQAIGHELPLLGPSPAHAGRLDAAVARHPLRGVSLVDRPYAELASAYAAAGRPDRARAVLSEYEREVRDTLLKREQAPDLRAALAEVALAEGRPLDAIAEFRRADTAYDGHPATDCTTCLPLALGRAFDAALQPDSAIAAYERYLATSWWWSSEGQDARFRAPVHRRLGELYEARGDWRRAMAHYERFVALWRDADASLRPQVSDVLRRITRLRARNG